jgi:hypothetical protein
LSAPITNPDALQPAKLSVSEVVDLYGYTGKFDVLAITGAR